jgi:hypothetical protein
MWSASLPLRMVPQFRPLPFLPALRQARPDESELDDDKVPLCILGVRVRRVRSGRPRCDSLSFQAVDGVDQVLVQWVGTEPNQATWVRRPV